MKKDYDNIRYAVMGSRLTRAELDDIINLLTWTCMEVSEDNNSINIKEEDKPEDAEYFYDNGAGGIYYKVVERQPYFYVAGGTWLPTIRESAAWMKAKPINKGV